MSAGIPFGRAAGHSALFASLLVAAAMATTNAFAGEECAVAGRAAERDTYGHDLILPCHASAGGTAPQQCGKHRRMTALREMPNGSRVDAWQL